MGTTSVDPAAVTAAGQRIAAAADIVAAVHTRLNGLRFGAATAGRVHGPAGDEVRRAVDRICADLTRWADAAGELGAALQTGADRYRVAEQRAATGLR